MTFNPASELPIFKTLAAEILAVEAFIQLLDQERTALLKNQPDDLERIIPDKSFKAQNLEQLARERKRLFETNGVVISAEAGHPIASAKGLPADAFVPLGEQWQILLDRARTASNANQLNGQLVENRQRQTQQLLKLLRTSRTPLIYDSLGQPQAGARGLLNDKV